MPNLIQSISNNAQPQKFFLTPAVQSAEEPQEQLLDKKKQEPEDNGYFSSGTIIASLSGLAVIVGGIWGIKSGKIRIGNGNFSGSGHGNINLSDIREQIADLKNILKPEYIAKRQKIVKELNQFGEYDYRVPFSNGGELGKEVRERRDTYLRTKNNADKIIKYNMAIIRKKMQALSAFPEFKELRKIRKALVKTVTESKSVDEIKIANQKIILVNDLLINRVYPREAVKYERIYGISDEKAFALVRKKHETYEEFMADYKACQNKDVPFDYDGVEKRFMHKNKLELTDIFPVETDTITTNRNLTEAAKEDYEEANVVYGKYLKKLKALALEFREIDEMKELKRLNQLLKTQLGQAA
ncbi:hypothetical protein IKP85_07050 [bacterium]|nr:hypothetical protein [bacterium]